MKRRPPFATQNRSERGRCLHCGDDGLAVLDTPPRSAEYGAPCPMCELGAIVNENTARRINGERLADGLTYWERCDVSAVSWQHGLTVDHDRVCRLERCERPARGAYCDYHADPATRLGGPLELPEELRGVRGYSVVPELKPEEQEAMPV